MAEKWPVNPLDTFIDYVKYVPIRASKSYEPHTHTI